MTFNDPMSNDPMSRTGDWGLPDPDRGAEFYADVPTKRLIAWFIDVSIIGMLTLLTLPLTLFAGLFFLPPIFLVVSFAYRVVTIANNSATPGMRVMGIEFRTARGQPFDLPAAAMHTTGYAVAVAMFPIQLCSMVLMATTARAQGLGDLVMGSAAINRATSRRA